MYGCLQADAVLNHKTIQMLEDNCHLQEVVVSSFEVGLRSFVWQLHGNFLHIS